jgi:hypothetical protein
MKLSEMVVSKEDRIIAEWEEKLNSQDIKEFLIDRIGTVDPMIVANYCSVRGAEEIADFIEYNESEIERTRTNERLRIADPITYGQILQCHIVDLKILKWLKENSPF